MDPTIVTMLILVVVVILSGMWILMGAPKKSKAPEADFWVGPIGFKDAPVAFGDIGYEAIQAVSKIEDFMSKEVFPIVVRFVSGPIMLADGRLACGKYHTADEWDHPWIELSTRFSGWNPTKLEDTALEHELMHHISGLSDCSKFAELFLGYMRFKQRISE